MRAGGCRQLYLNTTDGLIAFMEGLHVTLSPIALLPPVFHGYPVPPDVVLHVRSLGWGSQFCSELAQHLAAKAIPHTELRGNISTALEIIKYHKNNAVSVKKKIKT